MTDAITEFLDAASLVKGFNDRISAARYMPSARWHRVSNIKLVPDTRNFHEPKQDDIDLAARIRAAIAAEARIVGEQDKRDALKVISRDIEALRVLLPNMAAKACIELGVLARQLNEEATNVQ